MRTWIIGSDGACDIVVAQPRVSRRHCRFTELADGYLVEDLGSSNGTYINGERIAQARRVLPGDAITLGALEPLPWPPASCVPGATVITIGRAADNDIVLDDARVSSHHARLLVRGDRAWIEDDGSSNGTFLNSPDRRVTEAIPLSGTDTVYFGSLAVPAAQLRPASTTPEPAAAVEQPLPQESPPPVSAIPSTQGTTPFPWMALQFAQSPVVALLIVLLFGHRATGPIAATNWPAVAESIASTTFAMAISAVWLGGSLAAWATLTGRSSAGWSGSLEGRLLASPVERFAMLGGLCFIECAALLAIVSWGTALRGPWLAMAGVLVLTSAVGLSLGLLILSLIRRPFAGVAVLVVAFAVMAVMGGRIWRLSDSGAMATIAAAMPSRWAFEGLLLLESEHHAPPTAPDGPRPERSEDLAEGFFPSATERMGPKADAMALGFMLIGLEGAAGFISSGRRPPR